MESLTLSECEQVSAGKLTADSAIGFMASAGAIGGAFVVGGFLGVGIALGGGYMLGSYIYEIIAE